MLLVGRNHFVAGDVNAWAEVPNSYHYDRSRGMDVVNLSSVPGYSNFFLVLFHSLISASIIQVDGFEVEALNFNLFQYIIRAIRLLVYEQVLP